MVLFIVGFIGYFIYNARSMDNKSNEKISVDQLEKFMDQKNFTLINVHIPYQGEIDNTDLLIPFNAINQYKNLLPKNKDAKIVVYCMEDQMSNIAAEQLIKWDILGFSTYREECWPGKTKADAYYIGSRYPEEF